MATLLGIYEKFVLHLRVPLLVQDDTDHNEEMIESSTEFNHV